MTSKNSSKLLRGVLLVLTVAIAMVPVLGASAGEAATQDARYRKVSAPNTFFPVTGTRLVKDLRTYTARHQNTDIKAPCGVNVYASHPGVASVLPTRAWGPVLVRVQSSVSGLTTFYGYMSRAVVSNGQPIQSGQWIGSVGKQPGTSKCQLMFKVAYGTGTTNASGWLNYWVGRTPPVSRLFDVDGINVASFNVLGATHTRNSARYPTAAVRTPKALALINKYAADVVGLQEFQDEQKAQFMSLAGDTFGIFHVDADGPEGPKPGDSDNSIIWRNSTMELVDAYTFQIPYFYGNPRRIPAVLLRQKSSGREAWFLNTHNPADVNGPAQQWRNQAIAIEKAEIIKLRAQGRPVFLTGDFNDRQNAFCPLTANKLTISPNSIPNNACAYPAQSSIDWIFVAGQARFSNFVRDTYPQSAAISDHPFVVARAHLQN